MQIRVRTGSRVDWTRAETNGSKGGIDRINLEGVRRVEVASEDSECRYRSSVYAFRTSKLYQLCDPTPSVAKRLCATLNGV
jgi:hypothetical protein